MLYMGLILGTMFLGITHLANEYNIVPDPTGQQTVLSQLGHYILGDGPLYYYLHLPPC
jgi:hypothetical protein